MFLPRLELQDIKQVAIAAIKKRLNEFAAARPAYYATVRAAGKRGADKNSLIAHVQASRGRDAFYLSAEWQAELKRMVDFFAHRPTGYNQSDVLAIGRRVVEAILDNVRSQKHRTGAPFRELTERYAKQKLKRWGFIKPILRASGDLLDGLRVTAEQTTPEVQAAEPATRRAS